MIETHHYGEHGVVVLRLPALLGDLDEEFDHLAASGGVGLPH